MKTILLILLLSSCAVKEIQCRYQEVTLIKIEKVFRYGSNMKWQTWQGKDGVLRMVLVPLNNSYEVGDKILVLTKN
jgi:hypothetical protein